MYANSYSIPNFSNSPDNSINVTGNLLVKLIFLNGGGQAYCPIVNNFSFSPAILIQCKLVSVALLICVMHQQIQKIHSMEQLTSYKQQKF